MLDRTLAPALQPFRHIPLPAYQTLALRNGIPVHILPWGNTGIAEVNLVFAAGRNHAPPAVANMAMTMLTEGTQHLDAQAFAQALDNYGAYLGHEVENEYAILGLTSLSAYLGATVPLLYDAAFAPRFAPEAWEMQTRNAAGKLTVEQKTTSYQARRAFAENWFGREHPQGKFLDPDQIRNLELDTAHAFHQQYITANTLQIVVCGEFVQDVLMQSLEGTFGDLPRTGLLRAAPATQLLATTTGRITVPVPGLQSTLRLGHAGIARNHPDYYAMQFVTVMLGGYFGSRLMKNIREEKGYTYGISSMWIAEKDHGYLMIGADVGNDYVEDAIHQIKLEMKRLQEEIATEEEIELVRNYLIGTSIGQRETPSQMADLLAFSLMNDLPFPELDRKFDVIATMNAARVQELAQQWLLPEAILEVVAGA